MMPRLVRLSVAVVALLIQAPIVAQTTGVPAPGPARRVDRAQLMRDVETLAAPAFEGRLTGTPGASKARQWIVDQFRAIKLTPAGAQEYLQPFTFNSRDTPRASRPPYRTAMLPPTSSDGSLAVSRAHGRLSSPRTRPPGHSDYLYPGADDNARASRRCWPPLATLSALRRESDRICRADAEEPRRRARAHRFRAAPDAQCHEYQPDMLSRNARTRFTRRARPRAMAEAALQTQARASVNILFGHDRPTDRGGPEDWTHSSDHDHP
jgi:hypothetical protein